MHSLAFLAVMGGTTVLLYAVWPAAMVFDLCFVAALYVALRNRPAGGMLCVWVLGLLRGILSATPGHFPIYYPIFFLVAAGLIAAIADRIRAGHPLAQGLVAACAVAVYVPGQFWADPAITGGSGAILRAWPAILQAVLVNAAGGTVLFQVLGPRPAPPMPSESPLEA